MNLDTWLKRGSYISQILLVVIATFGYFYTVIPVFEKQKLSEDLIQAQLNLKEINKKYKSTYEKYRDIRVSGAFSGASLECTGLLKEIKQLPPLRFPLPKEEIVTINPSICFKERLDNFLNSKQINSKDQALLTKIVIQTTNEISNIYKPNEYNTFETQWAFYEQVRKIIQINSDIEWDEK